MTLYRKVKRHKALLQHPWLTIKYYIIIEVKHLYFMNTLKVLYQKFDFAVFSFLF